ncbi:MAG: SDR family NAD(P)-dependent oxidoreductase, partial [Bacteroidales bacterium]|nr:SDR family NAD(P)-dependent oxidoreductase [Bacteroidales bacterium]
MLIETIDNQLNKKKFQRRHAGKVVMVSGASSGIGKALAIELLNRGFNVSLAARRAEIITDYLHALYPPEVCE